MRGSALYISTDEENIEKRIVKASHFLATYWEFQMIYSVGITLLRHREGEGGD
ncbi:MAG: hypothetical protein Q9N34_09485 [Aquificota bacterium]|nr:hypothetical protein [Aquificota bacterium]